MIKHLRMKKMLSPYLDGVLSDTDTRLFEAHLAGCGRCRKRLEEFKKLSQLLQNAGDEEVSPDMEQKIRGSMLGKRYKGVANMKSSLFVKVSSVALAILLVIGVFVGSQNSKLGLQGRLMIIGDQQGDQHSPAPGKRDYARKRPPLEWDGTRGLSERDPNATMGLEFAAESPARVSATSVDPALGYREQFSGMPAGTNTKPAFARASGSKEEEWRGEVARPLEDKVQAPANGNILIVEPHLPAAQKNEKVIRTATVDLEVRDAQGSYDRIVALAKEKGGLLANAQFSKQPDGTTVAQLVVRVPVEHFEAVLDSLRALGEVARFDIYSQDISQEYENLLTDIQTVKVIYDKLVKKYEEKRVDVETTIAIESELTPYLKQIQALRNRIAHYDNLVAMPTITVNLTAESWQAFLQAHYKGMARQMWAFLAAALGLFVRALPAFLILSFAGAGVYWLVKRLVRGVQK